MKYKKANWVMVVALAVLGLYLLVTTIRYAFPRHDWGAAAVGIIFSDLIFWCAYLFTKLEYKDK